MAGEVDRDRQVGFTVQQGRHAIPGVARTAEAVKQDDALRHDAHPMAGATDTYTLLRAFVEELDALRDARGVHLPGVAVLTAGADAGP